MPNVPNYTAPARNVGDSGLIADVNAARTQVAAITAFVNDYSGDTGVLTAPAGQASTLFGPGLVTTRFQFGPPAFKAGSGSVEIQLNGGAFQSYSAFNTAVAALSDAQIQAANNTYLVRVNQINNAAATVEMAIL